MAITILIYASFTGLCAIAASWQELAFYRFLTGLGIGGEWAAGAALIAESFPEKSRAKAAGIMQASGGIGFFLATGLYLFIGPYGWRWVFALGVFPALVAFYIRQSLEEPDRWSQSKAKGEAICGPDLLPRFAVMSSSALAWPWSRPSVTREPSNGCRAGLPLCCTPKAHAP